MNFLIATILVGYLTYHIPKGGEKDSISNYFNTALPIWKKVDEGINRWYRWSHSVQFSSITQSCLILCDPMDCSTSGFPVHHQLLEFTQTHVWWCHPTISSCVVPFSSHLQSFPASGSSQTSQFFPSSGQSIGVSASASVFHEHSGVISLRMDWLDLLAVQETLKSSPTPQFKSVNSLLLSFLYSPTLTSIHD